MSFPSAKPAALGGSEVYLTLTGLQVFKMLWIEPAGQASLGQTRGSTPFSVVTYDQVAYVKIRRFVVVSNKGNFSQCIPIQTYRKRVATKPGLRVEDHGIIYTGVGKYLIPNQGLTLVSFTQLSTTLRSWKLVW
jgi:hypothetical protein